VKDPTFYEKECHISSNFETLAGREGKLSQKCLRTSETERNFEKSSN
jgi:hypothetical protein